MTTMILQHNTIQYNFNRSIYVQPSPFMSCVKWLETMQPNIISPVDGGPYTGHISFRFNPFGFCYNDFTQNKMVTPSSRHHNCRIFFLSFFFWIIFKLIASHFSIDQIQSISVFLVMEFEFDSHWLWTGIKRKKIHSTL